MATTKRIFIAFAAEDVTYRDFLKGQSLNPNSPFEFIDMSVKEPYDSAWKTKTRTRIKGCHGVIALLSSNSLKADGQLWEIKCAKEEAKPLLGVYVHKDDKVKPAAMGAAKCIEWTQKGIADFIDSL